MSYLPSIVVSFLTLVISEVAGEYCAGYGHSCHSPEYCCSHTCCRAYNHYSFWSMWYFWCIVVFVLMACFGGCGYYRRRQVLIQRRGAPRTVVFASATTHTVPPRDPYIQQAPPPPPCGTFPAPPPYNEVTSKPHMYPKAEEGQSPAPPYYPPGTFYPPPPQQQPFPQYQGPVAQLPPYETTVNNAPMMAMPNAGSNQVHASS